MKITWTPPDAPAQEWDFDPSRLMVAELDAIEKVTGLSGLTAWGEALNAGSASALRSLLWVVRKRQEPTLRYDAVDFAIGDLTVTNDDEAPPKDEEASASAATT